MPNLIKAVDQQLPEQQKDFFFGNTSRRAFFQYSGISFAGIALLVAGCSKEEDREGVYLGTGDIAVLNYVYALEQMAAGFYAQVTQSFYSGVTDAEKSLLTDIRDHNIGHREFFKNALGEIGIPPLDLDFSTVNFGSRDSVLGTAKTLKDLAVSACNGVGPLIIEPEYLTLIGKIVSVEARHAALLRNLISYGSFANSEVIDANGLDRSLPPKDVLAITSTYIKSALNAEDLPII